MQQRQINWWGVALMISGGGLNALAAELSKVLPEEISKQMMVGFGMIAIIAGLALELYPGPKQQQPPTPPPTT